VLLDGRDDRAAAAAAGEYLALESIGYDEAIEAARFLCRCVVLHRTGRRDTGAGAATIEERYAAQAVSALNIAVQNGFRDRHDLETSSTYNPLRCRDDFQGLLRRLTAISDGADRG
jgi:hypothetical protein